MTYCDSISTKIEERNIGDNEVTSVEVNFDVDFGNVNNYTWIGSLTTNQQTTHSTIH